MGEEAEEAQDAQIVLGDPRVRVADEAHRLRLDIRKSADEVDHLAIGTDIERVDRQVTALGVLLPVLAESHLGAAAVGLDIAAKRGHLEAPAVEHQRHRAVVDPGRHRLDPGRLGALHHRLGRQRGRKVYIGDRQAHQAVAHRPAGDARLAAIGIEQRKQPLQCRIGEPGLVRQVGHA